jgi:hypothetical protein
MTVVQGYRHCIFPNQVDNAFQWRIFRYVLSGIALTNRPLVWKVIPLYVETKVF